MALRLRVPVSSGAYVRCFEAQIDIVSSARIRVRGRLRDHRLDLEHSWLLTTPEYEVLEAGAIQHAGSPRELSPQLCARYTAIKGVRIGRGFSRGVLAALGEDMPGGQEHLLLAVEMARVGQQIYQFPVGFETRFRYKAEVLSADALMSWEKDRAYMGALADSCYTYRDSSAALFASRRIVSIVGPEVTNAAPGTERAFWRRKRLCITPEQDGSAFLCESAMEDPLHDIAIGFRVGTDGTVSQAQSRGARVPYSGLCEEPHRHTSSLDGRRLTREFVGELAEHVGGAQGCAHLFDLSVDCLRLFHL